MLLFRPANCFKTYNSSELFARLEAVVCARLDSWAGGRLRDRIIILYDRHASFITTHPGGSGILKAQVSIMIVTTGCAKLLVAGSRRIRSPRLQTTGRVLFAGRSRKGVKHDRRTVA
eukprot:scaffold376465_cov40-Prasinocladus_malaysianus.AAC.1